MDELQKEIILLSSVLDAYEHIILNEGKLPRELLKDFDNDLAEEYENN